MIAPANPLRGLTADAPYLASVLRSVKGPVVLVGHSYGGAVITNAAAGNPNVKALVYVAAFVPEKGDALIGLLGKYPGSEIPDAMNEVPFPNPDGTTGKDIYLKADKFRSAFAADLPRSVTNVMQAAQRPAGAAHLTEPTQAAAWHEHSLVGARRGGGQGHSAGAAMLRVRACRYAPDHGGSRGVRTP
ncbi:alpha/beta hydrolase [Streptomyces sp. NBC_01006]|uniref:alpha/beta hydrolase n=1 Tax=Streptomyces sp. NBC_01006 TaxID=2903716 RepID=UPI00386554EA|nr:alpha/beta hydrolase [Streptomyces sp. NBC_01006]